MYSTTKTDEDTEVLGRYTAKPSKIKVQSRWLTCKHCLYHCLSYCSTETVLLLPSSQTNTTSQIWPSGR